MAIEGHRQRITSRIQTPGFLDRKIFYPLMDFVVGRAERGKSISSWITSGLLRTGESRVAFEAETGKHLTRNPLALLGIGIIEAFPLLGDAGDTVVHVVKDAASRRLDRDSASSITALVAGVIPIVPSIAAEKAKEALEDGIMSALLRRNDQRVLDAIDRAARRGEAKRNP